jgi:hypothetical protein
VDLDLIVEEPASGSVVPEPVAAGRDVDDELDAWLSEPAPPSVELHADQPTGGAQAAGEEEATVETRSEPPSLPSEPPVEGGGKKKGFFKKMFGK